jgi:hypothetical protein
MKMDLSPQSLGLAKSVTNDVKVVIFYDRAEPLYSYISALLDEYHLANPKISVRTVDYKRDNAAAQQLFTTYKQYLAGGATNVVLFTCNGRTKSVLGELFGYYTMDQKMTAEGLEFQPNLRAFLGEKVVDAVLLGITSDKPFKAYCLTGHGEQFLDAPDEGGYQKFKGTLAINNVIATNLDNLLGTNEVPMDCNLLVIAGPRSKIDTNELQKIQKYIEEGGRVFALFDTREPNRDKRDTGLEALMADWGVLVGRDVVRDPQNTYSHEYDVVVYNFNTNHALVNSLLASRLQMIQPRWVGALTNVRAGLGITATELAWTGSKARVGTNALGRPIPLMVAVEKTGGKETTSTRGSTRMVVVGDSQFLNNRLIDSAENEMFAQNAINWLLDQTQVMQGVGPHPIPSYSIVMTHAQMRSVEWIFLAAMPGGVLLIGGFVWLRRRK